MLQLPLLGFATQGSGRGPTQVRFNENAGLDHLLVAGDGAMAGFSSELQAMLMQMSPQMLQRLDQLLAGGMSLPQAAGSLLREGAPGPVAELFADFLRQRLGAVGGDLAAGAEDGPGKGLPLPAALLEGLQSPGVAPRELVGASAPAVPALVAAAPTPGAQASAGGQLSPQLAGSLLDMGVPQAVGAKGWDGAIADRLLWMVQGDQQMAKLRLNPPNLGPLEVRLNVQQDQASVSFLAQHAAVREALEAALPRLREMFDQQSLQLVHADVSDPGAQQGDRAHNPQPAAVAPGPWGDEAEEGTDPVGASSPVVAGNGLIDLFA